jgi:quercetin dioxygenase-like cupin family protein
VGDATNLWAEVPDWGDGVGARRVVRAAGAVLGGSLWEFQPGASQFVYHFHRGTEELLIVLRGAPTVWMQEGDLVLAEGDVVPFARGPEVTKRDPATHLTAATIDDSTTTRAAGR